MANVSITGNIGRDPELREAGTSQVLKFSVADSEYIYVKGGEAEAQWYNCEVWGKQAERLSSILAKGTKVTIYGQLVQRSYEGAQGKGKSLDVKECRISLVGKKEAPAADAFSDSVPF